MLKSGAFLPTFALIGKASSILIITII